jgi:hypothetical protein
VPRSQTSLVAHCSCPVRAAITTPVGSPAAFLARFTDDGDLPRCCGGSAPTLTVSRPARCSLTLRPARSAVPLKGSFLEVLQAIRRLLTRPECFRLEREFAGPGFHRGEQCTLSRHTRQRRRACHARYTLGRKNYLFAGSDAGGERAASIYTLVTTAKLNNLNPKTYLRDILAKIAEGHTINRIDELVPWRMIPAATTLPP